MKVPKKHSQNFLEVLYEVPIRFVETLQRRVGPNYFCQHTSHSFKIAIL